MNSLPLFLLLTLLPLPLVYPLLMLLWLVEVSLPKVLSLPLEEEKELEAVEGVAALSRGALL